MSVGTSDLAKALNVMWDASTLDDAFKALWDDPTSTEFEVLNEGEASPGQPFPYCVFGIVGGLTTNRMSGGAAALREIRDVPLTFNIHASVVDGDSRTAKEIAAYLAEEVMKVFGGHPTTSPTALSLDNGKSLPTQYQTDWSVRTDDEEYQHIISYLLRADVPVAA